MLVVVEVVEDIAFEVDRETFGEALMLLQYFSYRNGIRILLQIRDIETRLYLLELRLRHAWWRLQFRIQWWNTTRIWSIGRCIQRI